MSPLLRFLYENPIIVLVIVAWLVSGLASIAGKAARRAQQQQQRRSAGRLEERMPRPVREIQAAPRPTAPQTAEDIARELRQLLGLDPGPTQRRPPAGEDDEARARREEAREEAAADAEPEAGDEVHRRVVPRPTTPTRVQVVVDRPREPRPARQHAHAGAPRLEPPPPQLEPTALLRFLPHDAARAIIALEVLGPPRALRPYDVPYA